MSERLEERLRTAARTYRRLGNQSAESMFLESADSITELQAENAKLRELVRKMMRFFEDGDYCAACEKVGECDAQEEYDDDCLMRFVFRDRMRELGIEVKS